MPPKGKKGKGKGKGKKSEPKQEEIDEETRLREELARQEAEELKRLQEEEEKKKAEEARIQAYESQIREEQCKEIQKYNEDVETLFKKNLVDAWEKRRWDDYLDKTKEMDSLDVKDVNAFISEWKDDEDNDTEKMFEKINECLKIKDDIASAMAVYPYEDTTLTLWNEIIDNLEILIFKKMDYVSFMILKDSRQRLNEFSQNMEYSTRDERSSVTLCLWANLHRAARSRGANFEEGCYAFRAPTSVVAEDCTARLLHTNEFDGLWKRLEQEESEVRKINAIKEAEKMESQKTPNGDVTDNLNGTTEFEGDASCDTEEKVEENGVLEKEAIGSERKKTIVSKSTDRKKTIDASASDRKESTKNDTDIEPENNALNESKELDAETANEETEDLSSVMKIEAEVDGEGNEIDAKNYDIPNILTLEEYIPIGGILHFDIFKVPKLTIKKKGISFIYTASPRKKGEEEPKLHLLDPDAKSSYGEGIVDNPIDLLGESKTNIRQDQVKESKGEKPNKEAETPQVEVKKTDEAVEEKKMEEAEDGKKVEETEIDEVERLDKNVAKREDEVDKDKYMIKIPISNKVIILEDPQPACFHQDSNAFSQNCISNIQYDPEGRQIFFVADQFGIFGLFQKKYINFPFKDWSLSGGEIKKLSLTGQHTSVLIEISREGCRVESVNSLPFTEMSSSWLTPHHVNEKLLSIGINIFADDTAQNFIKKATKLKKLENDIYNHMALLSQHCVCTFTRSKWNSLQSSDEFVLQFSFSSQTEEQKKPSLVFINQERAVLLKCDEDSDDFSIQAEHPEKFSSNLFHLALSNSQTSLPDITNKYACIKNVNSLLRMCSILNYS